MPTRPATRRWSPTTWAACSTRADLVFAASLEALNGNVAPLLPDSVAARPFPGHREAAGRIAVLLDGSYLWKKDPARFSQDPLSFRTTPQLHGALRQQFQTLTAHLRTQLNASDDNPVILLDVTPAEGAREQEARYYVKGTVEGRPVTGAVVPTAHFEPVGWALDAQAMAVGLSHLSNHSMQRANRLATKDFTGIDLLDGQPPGSLAGFWKTANVLQTRIYAETMPVSSLVQPSARDIEDVGTQAPLVVERLDHAAELAYRMLAVELAVAAQVVEQRQRQHPDLALGRATGALLGDARRPWRRNRRRACRRRYRRRLPEIALTGRRGARANRGDAAPGSVKSGIFHERSRRYTRFPTSPTTRTP